MARHASTYRQARRNEWANQSELSWVEYNQMRKEEYGSNKYGPARSQMADLPEGRSKYLPHIGAKQRAKTANWPDGQMHWPSKAR